MKKQTPGRPFASDKNLKEELIISAIKLFAENDIGNVSIKDIASNCNTTSAMVHYYFGSKDNLIEIIITDFFVPNFKNILITAIKPNNPLELVHITIDMLISLALEHPYIAKLWSRYFLHQESIIMKYVFPNMPVDIMQQYAALAKKGQDENIINKDLIPILIYPIIASNIFIHLHGFDFILLDNNMDAKIKHIKSFILKGVLCV